jgi:hypothetical protein
MKNIGYAAFYDSSISKISLNTGLVSIGDYAFYTTNLQSINIPSTVQSIGMERLQIATG